MALVHSLGTPPTDNSWVKSMANGLAKQYFNCLNSAGGKSSGPEDRFSFNLLTAATTLGSSKLTVSRMLFN